MPNHTTPAAAQPAGLLATIAAIATAEAMAREAGSPPARKQAARDADHLRRAVAAHASANAAEVAAKLRLVAERLARVPDRRLEEADAAVLGSALRDLERMAAQAAPR